MLVGQPATSAPQTNEATLLYSPLAAVGAGRFEMFESLLEAKLTHIKAVRRDGASALTLSIISSKARILDRIGMPGLETVSLTERNHETDGTKSCNMITKTNNTECRHSSLYVCVCLSICLSVCLSVYDLRNASLRTSTMPQRVALE